jgi:HAD superfamily hydrolase (TIGR01490 family)
MIRKLVIFDFCETLVDFQTADKFIDYVNDIGKNNRYKSLNTLTYILQKLRILALFNKFSPKFNLSKRLKLFQIKGVSKNVIDGLAIRFCDELLMNNLIEPLYNLLLEHSLKNDHILIVSGGYSPYIKYFALKFNIQYSIATEIEYENGLATGRIFGKDCLYDEKLVLIEDYIKNNNIIYDESVVYSDSITDLPIFHWADKAYVVSKGNSQKWASKYGFNEIIC